MAQLDDAFNRVRAYQQRVQGSRLDGLNQYGPQFQQARDAYAARIAAEQQKRQQEMMQKLLSTAFNAAGNTYRYAYSAPNSPARNYVQQYVQQQAAARGWTGAQWNSLADIIRRESGWNMYAQNPKSSAADLFQFLNGTRSNYGIKLHDTLANQTRAGLQYIADRYHDPANALRFWLAHNWY